jgi:hypothetical protein
MLVPLLFLFRIHVTFSCDEGTTVLMTLENERDYHSKHALPQNSIVNGTEQKSSSQADTYGLWGSIMVVWHDKMITLGGNHARSSLAAITVLLVWYGTIP